MLVEATGSESKRVEAALRGNPSVASFERDLLVSGQAEPNDSRFAELWGLNNTGQYGTEDADIDAPEAWELTVGSTGVVVAVIDSGVDPTHPDLYLNIWINQGEIPLSLRDQLVDVDHDGRITFYDLNDAANVDYVTESTDDANDFVDASDVTGPGGGYHEFTVVYTDNRGFDPQMLDGTEIAVTGWDGTELLGLSVESITLQDDDTRCDVVYRLPAPEGTWGPADDGDYEIALAADRIYDTQYNYAAAGVLGAFNVDTTDGLIRVYNYEDDAAGPNTLRAAVIEADTLPGENIVRLRPGTYELTIPGSGEDAALTGDLDVTENLILRGAGADVTTIDAAGLDRVLHVHPGVTLTLRDVTITGGNATSGGGILVEPGATLTLTRAGIHANTATTGGGLHNLGTLTVEQSALYDNTATVGGGLHNLATANLTNVTVSGNTATGLPGTGGGIANDAGATLDLVNATIANNRADNRGGGIDNAGTADLLNTIVTANTAPTGPDSYGTFNSQGYNLVRTSSDSTGWQPSDILDVDPLLGPLQDNDGPTLTHALLPDSPAIDAGSDAGAPATDQRGMDRPQDGDQDGTATVDIGAVERFYGEIRGLIFHDRNGNVVQDAGEPGLAAVKVYLDLNNNGLLDPREPATETDQNGIYSFTDPEPTTYSVTEVLPDGWEQTLHDYGSEIEVASLGAVTFFGNASSNASSISADGRYVAFESRATNLVAGDFNGLADIFVAPSMAEWLPQPQLVFLHAGQIIEDINFANRPLPGEIHGTAFDDRDRDGLKDDNEPGLVRWTIYLDVNDNNQLDAGEPSMLTDRHGEYSFTDLPPLADDLVYPASYTVREVQQDQWLQTFPRPVDGGKWAVDTGPGALVADVDFGNYYVGPGGADLDEISGTFFQDDNGNGAQDPGEPGLAGRTVFIDRNGNGDDDQRVTDAAGMYSFVGLTPVTSGSSTTSAAGSLRRQESSPRPASIPSG